MGPLFTAADEWSFVFALIIGVGFGYVLESAGFSTSRKLAGVFYGYDFTVLKVFFTASVTAGTGLLFFNYFGWIDLSAIFINKFYIGSAIVGGAIMGVGFVIGGFCPGTSACAMSIGKIDAMLYLLGFLVGVVIFDLAYPLYSDFYVSGNMGPHKIYDAIGISAGTAMFIFILIALVAFFVASKIEKKYSHRDLKY